jgi:hypothetical protein
VSAIVSEETFALVQELLAANKTPMPRRTIEPSISQGRSSRSNCLVGGHQFAGEPSPHRRRTQDWKLRKKTSPTKRRQEDLQRDLTRVRKSMVRIMTANQEDLL